MLRTYKNRLHVESKWEKCILQGQIKNKCIETDRLNKSLQKEEESKQLNPKCNTRRMIAHYKSRAIQCNWLFLTAVIQ